jgi:hypothetical protein
MQLARQQAKINRIRIRSARIAVRLLALQAKQSGISLANTILIVGASNPKNRLPQSGSSPARANAKTRGPVPAAAENNLFNQWGRR